MVIRKEWFMDNDDGTVIKSTSQDTIINTDNEIIRTVLESAKAKSLLLLFSVRDIIESKRVVDNTE